MCQSQLRTCLENGLTSRKCDEIRQDDRSCSEKNTDTHAFCSNNYCVGDTMMVVENGICSEDLELEMRRHIQACACSCNHMGHGNFMDYQVGFI